MPGNKKEKKEKSDKKEKEHLKMFFLRAESVADVCRRACSFTFNPYTLLLARFKGEDRLIDLGSNIGKTQLAYYAPTKERGSLVIYEPATEGREEKVTFTDHTDAPNKYCINVMRIDLGSFEVATEIDAKDVQQLRVGSELELVRAAIGKSAKDEQMNNIYAFSLGGKKVLAAFEIVPELSNDKPMFYYAVSESRVLGNFARYDYKNNTLDFSDSVGDHAYMYAKVINLAESFPFLKKIE